MLQWDVLTCAQTFDRLARRTFQERRKWWLTWWLYDGCYDGTVFDTALKEVFGEHRGMFGDFYRMVGLMAFLQALVHVVIAIRQTGISLDGDVQLCSSLLVRLRPFLG